MGQGQGKGQYSQIGDGTDVDSPEGPDLPPVPDTLMTKANQHITNIRTQAEHAVLR